ncbi:MAG: amino acid ABC transporter permease [Betaproteobacteria bacterium]
MNDAWQWQVFLRPYDGVHTYLGWMMSAWGWTLAVSLCALLVALVAGTAVGVARTVATGWIAFVGDAWTELFRNVPLLVQVFIWYYVLPTLVPALQAAPPFALVVLALGVYTSARIAEQVKAGIQAIAGGQRLASLALGLTAAQTYRHVLLPHAARILLPPLTSEAMAIVKNSSVAFAVSIPDLTMFAMQAQEETARGVEIYLGVTALYGVSSLAVNRIARWLELRLQVPALMGARA